MQRFKFPSPTVSILKYLNLSSINTAQIISKRNEPYGAVKMSKTCPADFKLMVSNHYKS